MSRRDDQRRATAGEIVARALLAPERATLDVVDVLRAHDHAEDLAYRHGCLAGLLLGVAIATGAGCAGALLALVLT